MLRKLAEFLHRKGARLGTGFLFLLALLLALIPGFLLILRDHRQWERNKERQISDELESMVRLVARDYNGLFASTLHTLSALSQIREIRQYSAESFGKATTPLLAHYPHFKDFRLMTPEGTFLSSDGKRRTSALENLPHFQEALQHGKFFMGIWLAENPSQRPTLYGALPLRKTAGSEPRVLMALFKTSALDQMSVDIGLPNEHELLLLGEDLTVLATDAPDRFPPGKPIPAEWAPFMMTSDSMPEEDASPTPFKDRVFSWTPLDGSLAPGWRVVLGLEKQSLSDDTDTRWIVNLGLLALLVGLVFLLGTLRGALRGNRRVAPFLEATDRWTQGDFSVRVNAAGLSSLHQRWANDLNQLAETLQQKEQDEQNLRLAYDQKIAERTEEVLSTNRQWESFTQAVSQNLRAPLRAIDGFSLILLNEHAAGLTADGRHFLDIVIKNTKHLSRFVEELTIFTQMIRQEPFPARVEMAVVAQEVFQELLAEEPNRRVRLEMDDLPPAKVDPSMVRQLWSNFFENAIKFTSHQTNPLIHVGGAPGHPLNTYWIKDNGVGFNPQHTDRLFHVFQRLHTSSEFEGSGVGLATIQRIVQKHNGRLWAESRPGAGAAFFFCLPSATDSSTGETPA